MKINYSNLKGITPDQDSFHLSLDTAGRDYLCMLLNRAINCFPDCDQRWKELTNFLDNYIPLELKEIKSISESTVLYKENDNLKICQHCGGKGFGHFHTCPTLTDSENYKP
jgi:hypothetical protein